MCVSEITLTEAKQLSYRNSICQLDGSHLQGKGRGHGRSWKGLRWACSTLTPQHPRVCILAASSTNKKCWHFIHFSEMPQTKREKPRDGFSPPPSPRQETENRCPQWTHLLLASSLLLVFTAEEHRRWKNWIFFTGSRGKSLILRKGLRRTARLECLLGVRIWHHHQASLWITRGPPSATSDLLSLQLLCKENDGLRKHLLALALGQKLG